MTTTPCANARRHLADGEHDGTQAVDGYLCRSCTRRLEQRIAELPWLYVWVHMNLITRGIADLVVSGSREPPAPASLVALVLLNWPAEDGGGHDPVGADGTPSILGELDSWIRVVLEEHRPQLAGPAKPTVDVMSLWLLARMPWLVEQRWVDELAERMDFLHSVINGTVGNRPVKRQHLFTPCPGCDLRALTWNSGYYECDQRVGGCGRLLKQDEYEDWTQRWAVWAHDQEVAV